MKFPSTFSPLLGLVMLTAACTTSLDVDDVIANMVDAQGGADALDAIESIRTRVLIEEPAFTVSGDYRATSSGLMRIDVYAGDERVFSEGIDENGAWQWTAKNGIEPTSEKGKATLQEGIEFNLFGLHRFKERGHKVELEGEAVIDDTAYRILKVTLKSGEETWLYINQQTSMVERQRDFSALHPDVDPVEKNFETVSSDFFKSCGVVLARTEKKMDLDSGDTVQTTTVENRQCNLPADELKFDRNADQS
jgi:hypothetical protein